MKESTELIHSIPADLTTGAISVPIYQTTTYVFKEPGIHRGYDYTRTGNPTRKVLEDMIAKAERGTTGAAFASGMAATDAVFRLLKSGDHVIAGNDIYGGTFRILTTIYKKFGVETSFVNLNDREEILSVINKNTRMIWTESPTNPLLRIIDIRALAEITKSHGLLLCIDNTFATPVSQKPIELGADIVVHSATKYIGGHSDVISGLVVTASKALGEEILYNQNATGGVLSPFESWLLIRGIETLDLRYRQHCENAIAVAGFLKNHKKVKEVFYPGLPDNPGYETALAQQKYFGGMVSFQLKDNTRAAAFECTKKTKLIQLAESLGGIKSTIAHPATMTHVSIPVGKHHIFGITEGLLRLSVGLEDKEDIMEDLDSALKS